MPFKKVTPGITSSSKLLGVQSSIEILRLDDHNNTLGLQVLAKEHDLNSEMISTKLHVFLFPKTNGNFFDKENM